MRIIVTRPPEYSREFIDLIKERSLDYYVLPCLDFAKPSDNYQSLDKVIRSNHEYDWLIFLSKKAAEIFFDRLLDLGGHLFNLSPRLKIACVGETTAAYVRDQVGFPVDFVPSEFNSQCFLEEFKPDEMSRVILVRNENVKDQFIEELSAKVMALDLALAYRTEQPEFDLRDFDAINKQDMIFSFTSSETVRNFNKLLGADRIADLAVSKALSIGPRTSETIAKLLPEFELIEAKAASLQSMLDAIMALHGQNN